jgi:hypothetical protein
VTLEQQQAMSEVGDMERGSLAEKVWAVGRAADGAVAGDPRHHQTGKGCWTPSTRCSAGS